MLRATGTDAAGLVQGLLQSAILPVERWGRGRGLGWVPLGSRTPRPSDRSAPQSSPPRPLTAGLLGRRSHVLL